MVLGVPYPETVAGLRQTGRSATFIPPTKRKVPLRMRKDRTEEEPQRASHSRGGKSILLTYHEKQLRFSLSRKCT